MGILGPMRFGLSLPHYGFSLPGSAPITFEAMAAWAIRAEELGFDSVSISDHFFYSFGRYGADPQPIASLEPMTALAGLAAVTDRVRLGTLVLCAPFRHPSNLAKMAATIDQLSGGAARSRIGAGWLEQEFSAFGYPFGTVGERFEALEETLQVLEALFSGAPATFDGPTVALRDARLLPGSAQEPRIPVWVGGKGGPRLLRLAARHADGWNAVWRWAPEAYAGPGRRRQADLRSRRAVTPPRSASRWGSPACWVRTRSPPGRCSSGGGPRCRAMRWPPRPTPRGAPTRSPARPSRHWSGSTRSRRSAWRRS